MADAVRCLRKSRRLTHGDWVRRPSPVSMVATAGVLAAALATAPQIPEYELPLPLLGGSGGATQRSPSASPAYLNPFPVVRLAGRITHTGVRITLLRVRSPRGSDVTVRCRGGRSRGCPFKSKTRTSPASRLVRFRRLERSLRPRIVLEVFVRRGDTIGKYTSFKIRRGKSPKRQDSCVMPGAEKPSECPG